MCSYRSLCDNSSISKLLKELWPARGFGRSFALFYEGQVPNVAVFLTSGTATVMHGKITKELKAPVLIGIRELLDAKTSRATVLIHPGAEASIFDRVSLAKRCADDPDLQDFILTAS